MTIKWQTDDMEQTKKTVKSAALSLDRSRVANETTQELRGVVNAKSKVCAHEDCNIIPSCNYEGKTKRSFCSVPKGDGMECVKKRTGCQNHKDQPVC